jgi:hypothetical protein
LPRLLIAERILHPNRFPVPAIVGVFPRGANDLPA